MFDDYELFDHGSNFLFLFCRSAEFDESSSICRLSREDRRSQPAAFRRQPGSTVDYLENQCVRCKW
jgi:hypothetical protein